MKMVAHPWSALYIMRMIIYMKPITFITGNEHKARYFSEILDKPIPHTKVDLDEIQSLDLREVVHHKVHQAYTKLQTPVLVEDTALEFTALGRIPGTFIKWFLDEMTLPEICALLDNKDRTAIARCVFGYYDGVEDHYFEGALAGNIAQTPQGNEGYGWDPIFIPDGYTVPRAALDKDDYAATYTTLKPFTLLKEFLSATE